MARRLTDTYFIKYDFSIRFENNPQRLNTKSGTSVFVIPESEQITEYVKSLVEVFIKHTYGNEYRIADFIITEITPL